MQAQAQRLLVELGVPLLLAMPSVGAVLAPVPVPVPGLAMLAAMLLPGLAMLVPGLAVLVPVVETQDH